jgi:beta-lactam-binding protein with PASTA domain
MSQRRASNSDNFFVRFFRQHFIISNIILIFAALIVFALGLMFFVDLWTHHGETTVVPDVRKVSFTNACDILDEAGLKVVISDSIYDDNAHPGQVVDVQPKPGVVVKPGREVYLTIVAFHPKQIVIDIPLTDVSYRQAESYLKSRGIKTINRVDVPSVYDDLVVGVKLDGKSIGLGSVIPVNGVVTLEVGRVATAQPDSDAMMLDAAIDSAIVADTTPGDGDSAYDYYQ